jgi:tRNA (guanine37-N1)-methyltransferase
MEVIAGIENFIVNQVHLDCIFKFDFSKVYWNTRLSTEHARMVELFEGEVVVDVFAGVGPFAVPAGKKRNFVLANDLNPASFESLQGNIEMNKV